MPSSRRRQFAALGIYALIVVTFIGLSALPTAIWRITQADSKISSKTRELETATHQLSQVRREKDNAESELQHFEQMRVTYKLPPVEEVIQEHAQIRSERAEFLQQKRDADSKVIAIQSKLEEVAQLAVEAQRREQQLLALRDAQGWVSGSCEVPRFLDKEKQTSSSTLATRTTATASYAPFNCTDMVVIEQQPQVVREWITVCP